jgi:NADH-quinone oxidoreductase subunit J
VQEILFYVVSVIAVTAALIVILQRRAVYSALALIVCFGSMAILFYQLGAPFLAAIQVILYAGAIMVLFVFVIMLLDPEAERFPVSKLKRVGIIALPLVAFFWITLLQVVPEFLEPAAEPRPETTLLGETEVIARVLFVDYLLPFEIISILILVAIIGAVVLARQSD